MNEIKRIKELVALLNRASDAYYNTGNTIMEDREFDALMEELRGLEQETRFIMSNSPTQNVGAEVKTELAKVKHERPMLSLDKCHSIQELIDFAENDDCYLSVKCDGLTTRLIYENGELVGAETRGDGEVGQDVLFHAKEYINAPTHIPVTNRYIIDGESVIFYADFEAINSSLPEDERFANSRNLASGTLSNLDANITRQRNMRFIAWRVIEGDNDDSHFWRLKNAERLGFTVVPMWTYTNKSNDPDHLEDMLHNLRKQANDMGLPMDGIVMAKNSHVKAESMGRTAKFFRHSIAYKFEDEEYETKLSGIEFTMGKTGSLTPTAIFRPVEIDGTTVERASLANLSIIKKLGLTNNCTVFARKANCIIPQITRALQDGDGEIKIPLTCPICSGKTAIIKENESEVLVCTNPECSGKLLGKLKFFVSKPAANIDGLSEATLAFLIDRGWVKNFRDIYHLDTHKNEWQRCDGFGKKSVEKILNAIEKSRNIDLAHFICSLSIPNIGSSAAKTIAYRFESNYDRFIEAWRNCFDFAELDDFGVVTSESLDNYLCEHINEVQALAAEMHFIIPEKNNEATNNPFTGKILCVTGKLNHFTRDSINEKIASLGAKAAGSVSRKTDFLITNDASGSAKYKKAVELNVPIITEDEFIKMLEG
jgi:DNA ligase (NAD+)